MAALVWVLWPASVIFTATLCFRLGAYWNSDDHTGRHRAGAMQDEEPWDEQYAQDKDHELGGRSGLPPAIAPARRWWSDDDDTEVLPQVQDIRPPMRATPIRKPPWMR
ncbi:hypothetical protein [Nocardia sp. alder85J]|uniref:hypothetical protein n=1 Tax=Nocardia sp. alder85J TaxID=2862949 RepID=UPI001CD4A121|nr:hypothetical protein [Nocardia sp. alder85J]MCX4098038.1 hypothetical protein [Nocardia sp. alder85J]